MRVIKTEHTDWVVTISTVLSSTQSEMRSLIEQDKVKHGLVVQSMMQDKGRGRQGREWVSPMGNVYISILLQPDVPFDQIGQLAFVAGLAISDAIEKALPEAEMDKVLKWPNDVWVNGKKCSGILIERDGDNIILGVGLNVLTPPDDAIGLKDLLNDDQDPPNIHEVRNLILYGLDTYYNIWLTKGFDTIRNNWLNQAHKLGQNITVKSRSIPNCSGTVVSIVKNFSTWL
jgi:BirA family biotin operon repressor/biotin-[acetyl-CoA-carboxylase] ligase